MGFAELLDGERTFANEAANLPRTDGKQTLLRLRERAEVAVVQVRSEGIAVAVLRTVRMGETPFQVSSPHALIPGGVSGGSHITRHVRSACSTEVPLAPLGCPISFVDAGKYAVNEIAV